MTATTAVAPPSPGKPPIWTTGDWNALFGFGTNILVNILVLTGLLRFVLKMPDAIVFGRILPATGLMMFLSTMYYAFIARRLARETGREDVCALPSGISVPHMFVVTGVTTEVCVNTTVREANDRGYDCLVAADCCASYFPEFHDAGLRMIRAQGGIFGWTADSAEIIAALPQTLKGAA